MEVREKERSPFSCNCFQYLFNALLQFGAMMSVFLVVVALNYKILHKDGKEEWTEQKRDKKKSLPTIERIGIECFKMAQKNSRMWEAVASKQNENSFRKKWNVPEQNTKYSEKTKFLSFEFIL